MAKKSSKQQLAKAQPQNLVSDGLVNELRELIQETRSGVAQSVNSALVQLYWQAGTRIRTEVLQNERADYGKQICSTLSNELTAEFGSGFSRPNLTKMMQFSEFFPEFPIVSTLSRQLCWSHFAELIRQKDPLKRDFYAEMCRVENWSVRTLRSKIGGKLFDRTTANRSASTETARVD